MPSVPPQGDVPINPSPSTSGSDASSETETSRLLAALNESIAAGSRSPDSIFSAATDAARALTDADGVALALRTNGAVVCRARSGPTAPDLGVRLDTAAGISGQCLRTAQVLRCDDAQADPRVDPDVCRRLGIRSMIAIPIRDSNRAAGILEAFSARPYGFGAEQISLLSRLAQTIEVAYSYESAPRLLVSPRESHAIPGLATAESPTETRLERILSGLPRTVMRLFISSWSSKKPGYRIAAAVVSAFLIAAVLWINWQSTDREVAFAERASSASESIPRDSAPMRVTAKPDTSIRTTPSDESSARGILRSASQLQPQPTPGMESHSVLKVAAGGSLPITTPFLEIPAEPPSVAVTEPDNQANLGTLVSRSPDIPSINAVVSEGVTPPVLLHRVLPTYPVGSRIMGQTGSVVLNITIGEDGIPRDLKVVSGEGPLAQAGIEAVQRWRYRPALLNGKAVPTQQQITIVFKVQ